METSEPDSIVRALRRLTTALWALVIVLGAFLAMYLVAYIPSFSFLWSTADQSQAPRAGSSRPVAQYDRFHELPIEKQIEGASVIAIARYRKDGERMKCLISEILKQAPATTFYFKVGDEYPRCGYYPGAEKTYGDGQIMFFVGSPAEFRFSMSFFGDRITGMGEMPIELLRKKIAGEAK